MSSGLDADRAAIARLRQINLLAVRSQNHGVLSSLLTEDAVLMAPGSDFQRERPEFPGAGENMSLLEYDEEFEELEVSEKFAYEWGVVRCVYMLADGEKKQLRYKVLRILQRQADGEWKVHRAIWNEG